MIRCADGRRRAPLSRPAATVPCSVSWPARKHSVVAEPDTDTDLVNELLAAADAVVWSRGSTVAESELHPRRAARESSAPDRHVDHPVRTGRAVARSAGDRVHPAGVVRRHRRAGPRITRSRTGIRRRPGRRVPGRRVCQRGDAGVALHSCAGAGELLDLSMLEAQILGLTYLPGHVLRDAGTAVAGCPQAHRARNRPRQRRSGGRRMRHRAAMVRPVRDDRPPRLDRRGLAAVDHRAWPTKRPPRSTPWFDTQTVDDIRDLATAFRIPNAPVANGANITELEQFAAPEVRSSPIPRDGFSQPGPPYRMQPATLRRAATGAAARRAHRALPTVPASVCSATTIAGRCSRSAAVQRLTRAGHDHLLGRAELHAFPGDARGRGDPRRVDPQTGRHPADRRHSGHRGPVVGEVADLLGAEHQQEGPDARPADLGGPGPVAPLDRNRQT